MSSARDWWIPRRLCRKRRFSWASRSAAGLFPEDDSHVPKPPPDEDCREKSPDCKDPKPTITHEERITVKPKPTDPTEFETARDEFSALVAQGSLKISYYWGRGGSITIGRRDGQWFIRGAGGVGYGGGIKFDPFGRFPEAYTGDVSDRIFIGNSAGVGLSLGPASAEYAGEAGLLSYQVGGRRHVKYHSAVGPKVSLKVKEGLGLGAGAYLNFADVGFTFGR